MWEDATFQWPEDTITFRERKKNGYPTEVERSLVVSFFSGKLLHRQIKSLAFDYLTSGLLGLMQVYMQQKMWGELTKEKRVVQSISNKIRQLEHLSILRLESGTPTPIYTLMILFIRQRSGKLFTLVERNISKVCSHCPRAVVKQILQ